MPYWMTKLSSLEKGSRRLCKTTEEEQMLDVCQDLYEEVCTFLV